MNKTAGDLHCPSPTDLGPSGPISLPYDPTSDGVLSPVLPTLTVKKKVISERQDIDSGNRHPAPW